MNQAAAPNTGGAPAGNQHAVRAKIVRDALRRSIATRSKGDFEEGIKKICDKVVSLAEGGEQWAVQELFNRLEGRVAQGVEVSGPNGSDIVVRDAATSMGIARRVAFVLAQGALAKAQLSSREATDATVVEG